MSEEKTYIIKNELIDDCNKRIAESRMSSKNKDKYKYHLEVLPHPNFGNVKEAKILFLAINPSYDKFEDEYDTLMYTKTHENIDLQNENDEFYKTLKNVNFLEEFDKTENLYFFNAWHWWNKKVIGYEVEAKKPEKFAFVNLCGYHSKSFNDKYYFANSIINDINFKDLELVIIVWGEQLWRPY